MDERVTMNDILSARLGKVSSTNEIKVSFRKTIQTKQYESEVTEIEYSLTVDNTITGIERILITSILQAQAEYAVYTMLALQNKISSEDFLIEKESLEKSINALRVKAIQLLGDKVDIDSIIANTKIDAMTAGD